ncbi:MAG TPA: ATP-binding protein [Thermoanaerobaculia bacterium]|nr:ATP-binding protein [Thermoanaerobaculia bacterium]
MRRLKTLLSWSSGKDSAWTLYRLQRDPRYEIAGLVTTINAAADRVAMHAVRTELLRAQARAARLPLWELQIPSPCSNDEYEAVMRRAVARAEAEAMDCFAFGDLFLEDIRAYREKQLAPTKLQPIFPLWRIDTTQLAREMIDGGLRARITCVDPRALPPAFAGREFDHALLDDLPASVDPCGERGEFHTFAYAGPMFREPLRIESGVIVERDGFVFADLLPP